MDPAIAAAQRGSWAPFSTADSGMEPTADLDAFNNVEHLTSYEQFLRLLLENGVFDTEAGPSILRRRACRQLQMLAFRSMEGAAFQARIQLLETLGQQLPDKGSLWRLVLKGWTILLVEEDQHGQHGDLIVALLRAGASAGVRWQLGFNKPLLHWLVDRYSAAGAAAQQRLSRVAQQVVSHTDTSSTLLRTPTGRQLTALQYQLYQWQNVPLLSPLATAACVNCAGHNTMPPLMIAIYHRRLDVIEELLAAGADSAQLHTGPPGTLSTYLLALVVLESRLTAQGGQVRSQCRNAV
jgi:hypothetical protein